MPLAALGAFSRRQTKLWLIEFLALVHHSFQKYTDIAWRQNCREQFWTAAGRSRRDAGQGRPAHKFVRNEFGRSEATARRAKHKEVFRNATTVAGVREQYTRVADKAKSPLN